MGLEVAWGSVQGGRGGWCPGEETKGCSPVSSLWGGGWEQELGSWLRCGGLGPLGLGQGWEEVLFSTCRWF